MYGLGDNMKKQVYHRGLIISHVRLIVLQGSPYVKNMNRVFKM